MRSGVDGSFELSCVPQLDGIVTTARYHKPSISADIQAARPRILLMCITNLPCWSMIWSFTAIHDKTTVQSCCYKNTAPSFSSSTPCNSCQSRHACRTCRSRLVDNHIPLFHAVIDIPYSDCTVRARCNKYIS